MKDKVAVIGGGLAGTECAYQLAKQGIKVTIFEMKPKKFSPAHKNPDLAELVCSNSFRSEDIYSCVGLLKREMRDLDSLIMKMADKTKIPAGKALAVDREKFAHEVTLFLEKMVDIDIKRKEIISLSDPDLTNFSFVVIAAGPLITSELVKNLTQFIGKDLYFYDAIAPIVSADSINWDKVFWGARYEPNSKDYLNCPMTEEEYYRFREALLKAKKVPYRDFEDPKHFEGCLPIEVLAERGEMTLAFGPLKPVGLIDPRTGKRPFAVVQLRPENLEKTMFNLVGFQTKLTYKEQERVFRLIPGLENARFERYGSMHRNTYVNAPKVLTPTLELKKKKNVFMAGQITGVEGYVESAACGLWLGIYLSGIIRGKDITLPPEETALGGLLKHLRTPKKDFQPMNANFGLMPPVKAPKRDRKKLYVKRAREAWKVWVEGLGF